MSTAPLLVEQEKIVIIDFGSSSNQLLTRTIRQFGMYSEMHPFTVTAAEVEKMNAVGIILSGSPYSVEDDQAFKMDPAVLDMGIPILGIGHGANLIVQHYGGKVIKTAQPTEVMGTAIIEKATPVIEQTGSIQAFMSTGDDIQELPAGFEAIAKANNQVVGFANVATKTYGLQFYPESPKTEGGLAILEAFVANVCEVTEKWTMAQFIDIEVEKIRATVGDRKVLCALSGGVDSSVVAALIHRAIGDQLTCMFVDHGLLRKGEAESVVETFSNKFNMNFIKIDAADRFLSKLAGVSDPETKRKIIGNEFIYVFDDEASKLDGIDFLAQGTLYTDILESGTATKETIKSHHNVGGLPEEMDFELIEPLAALFKDEVRAVGSELGLSDEIVWRQPFPGPGLGIRVLGEVTEEKLHMVRESDFILREEIKNAGLERDIWQYFTVLPNIQSVGVKNGERTYDYAIGIRAVHSVDGVTSEWAKIPWELLEKISSRITTEVQNINRVLFDVTSKPPSTIEWE